MRAILLALITIFAVQAVRTAEAAPARNIVVIVIDDIGIGDLGFSGSTDIRTPNIDALAADGVIMNQAYMTASVCSPARAGILAGTYPGRTGQYTNPPGNVLLGMLASQRTIAEVLGGSFADALIGKWHEGRAAGLRPLDQGFGAFFGFLGSTHDYFAPTTVLRNNQTVPVTKYLTEAFGDEAVDFIDDNAGRRFFLYWAPNAAHGPLQATQKYLDRYPNIANSQRRTYAAMISALDDQVGRVHEALVANGLDNNTLILFTSDNGAPPPGNNRFLRAGKGGPYDGGLRVPMFFRWPGTLPAGHYPHPVSGLDFLPTAVAAAGVAIPAGLDGVNLLPRLQGQGGRPHDVLAWRIFGKTSGDEWHVVRVGDLKLIDRVGGAPQVFNLANDPGERNNIASTANVQSLRAAYAQETANWSAPRW